jgi:hypothetical protein
MSAGNRARLLALADRGPHQLTGSLVTYLRCLKTRSAETLFVRGS